ncbi:unnamed protein product [Cylindrotheca closterium]|uniref:Helicase-associated domain-containing protein n=1 Tax=Cylindrotheca closterium TaxID=2856 RepID=A0AAD2FP48_9STRA|nr:unnamed protein product [Cylindrotheca closterium]
MAMICSIDFNTSPNMNPFNTQGTLDSCLDRAEPEFNTSTCCSFSNNNTMSSASCYQQQQQQQQQQDDLQDSFYFHQGRVAPELDLSLFSLGGGGQDEQQDLEPVPIGAYKSPYQEAHLQSMLKESVEFLFGSNNATTKRGLEQLEQDGFCCKKRKLVSEDYSEDFSDDCSSRSSRSDVTRFRPYQNQQWGQRFEDLQEFRKVNGHCSVPYDHPPNPTLARWVKRQRYQYKLHVEGQPSAMTEERVQALEGVGFVWDTYSAAWERRKSELRAYRAENGHCNVPATFKVNKKLAAWVKCQRRQYKLFHEGKPSTLNHDRIEGLNQMGFQWEVRSLRRQ